MEILHWINQQMTPFAWFLIIIQIIIFGVAWFGNRHKFTK